MYRRLAFRATLPLLIGLEGNLATLQRDASVRRRAQVHAQVAEDTSRVGGGMVDDDESLTEDRRAAVSQLESRRAYIQKLSRELMHVRDGHKSATLAAKKSSLSTAASRHKQQNASSLFDRGQHIVGEFPRFGFNEDPELIAAIRFLRVAIYFKMNDHPNVDYFAKLVAKHSYALTTVACVNYTLAIKWLSDRNAAISLVETMAPRLIQLMDDILFTEAVNICEVLRKLGGSSVGRLVASSSQLSALVHALSQHIVDMAETVEDDNSDGVDVAAGVHRRNKMLLGAIAGLSDFDVAQRALPSLTKHLDVSELSPTDVVTCVATCAATLVDDARFYDECASNIALALPNLSVVDVCIVMEAFARVGHRNEPFFRQLMGFQLRKLNDHSPYTAIHSLSSAARFGYKDRKLFTGLGRLLLRPADQEAAGNNRRQQQRQQQQPLLASASVQPSWCAGLFGACHRVAFYDEQLLSVTVDVVQQDVARLSTKALVEVLRDAIAMEHGIRSGAPEPSEETSSTTVAHDESGSPSSSDVGTATCAASVGTVAHQQVRELVAAVVAELATPKRVARMGKDVKLFNGSTTAIREVNELLRGLDDVADGTVASSITAAVEQLHSGLRDLLVRRQTGVGA